MARRFVLPSCFLLALASSYACSASTGDSSFGSGGAASVTSGAGPGKSATSTGDLGFDAGNGDSGSQGGSGPGCAAATQFVYTLAIDKSLYKFDPPTLAFTLIGTLNCPTAAGPFSMAVDRNASAWVVFTDGTLFKVDTKTAACTATSFVPGQHGFTTFGMGFSANAVGSSDDTLYVSDSSNAGTTKGLAKIDLTTLTLTPIGMYDKVNARAEMTGTGDAKLFGAFEGSPYDVAQIDKTNAHILSQAPQPAINYPPNSSNFAFAAWGGDFWLFVGPGTKTDVFHYNLKTNLTTLATTVPQVIVGAGVSTCAPIKPPT